MFKKTRYYVADDKGKYFLRFRFNGTPKYVSEPLCAAIFQSPEHAQQFIDVMLDGYGNHHIISA